MSDRIAHRRPPAVRGGATLVLLAASVHACGDGPSQPTDPGEDPPAFQGTVTAAGGGQVEGLMVIWRPRGATGGDTARIRADGTFEMRPSRLDRKGELLIDGAAPRSFHPFLYPVDLDSVATPSIVLVPLRWTVRAGEFAGQEVETRLDPAVDDDPNFLFSYYNGRPDTTTVPVSFHLDLTAWREGDFPAQVALDHNGASGFTAQDSAMLWGVLDRMEEIFGQDLFEPVVAEPGWFPLPWLDDPGYRPGVLRLTNDPQQWLAMKLPLTRDTQTADLESWVGPGSLTALRVDRGFLDGGVLGVGPFEPLRLSDGMIPWETVMMHEMLHVLGVGHTCRIPSPQGPCVRTAEVSAFDVAYIELLREVLTLEAAAGTQLGLVPAMIGERRVMLGLPALPGGS